MPRRGCVFIFNVLQAKSNEPTSLNVKHSVGEILQSKYHILYININSLKNKLDDLEIFVHNLNENGSKINIIAVTEINLHEEEVKFYNIQDYNSFFNPFDEGGVALFVHKSLASGVVWNSDYLNINCLIANIPALNLNVGVLYKHPTAATEELLEYYDLILKENQRAIFLGHMNVELSVSNFPTRRYIDSVKDHGFSILNKIDHDSLPYQNPSITDHVLSNVKKFKYSLSLSRVPFSKHQIMVLGFDDNKPDKVEFVAERNSTTYEMIDYRLFSWHFSQINLQRIYSFEHLVSVMDDCKSNSIIQKKGNNQNQNKQWIYDSSLNKSQRNKMRSVEYARQISEVSSKNLKKQWGIINGILTNQTSGKHSIDAIQNRTRQIVTNKKEIANILNGYFLDIGSNLHKSIPHMNNCPIPQVNINEFYIDSISTNSKEVKNIIKIMSSTNSIHDCIPLKMLKKHSHILSPLLAKLINNIFFHAEFPESLKIDRISPAFKSKDPLLPKNYRPISVPLNFSKIIELIISNAITEFCLEYKIIEKDQYGFQKNSSAMSAVVSVVDCLQVGLNACPESIGACLFIDLKKASNTVPHDLLMDKLHRIGIRGNLYTFIKSYLHQRRQYVIIDNVFPSKIVVNTNPYSVPQGSALSNLFFLLYINDILKLQLHGKIILYADDTAIVYVENDATTLKKHMASDLKLLNKWFNINALTLNTYKTKVMVFNGNMNLELNLKIRNNPIDIVETHKYLGIELQNTLMWGAHIEKIIRKINAIVDASKKNFSNQLHENIAYSMYQKEVYSRLSNMAAVYGTFANKSQLKRLQAAQNKAINFFYFGQNYNNINEIYAKHRLLNVKQIVHYDLALLIYKLHNNLLKLNRPHMDDINGKNILAVGVKYFQSLHHSIRNQNDVNDFKRLLRQSFFWN